MTKAPTRRLRTGHRRRGTKRKNSSNRRAMHLNHNQVCFRTKLQNHCLFNGAAALVKLCLMPQLLFVYNYIRNDPQDGGLGLFIMAMLHVNFFSYMQSVNAFRLCENFDFILHDIPFEEEAGDALPPRQNIRFDSWTDQKCYKETSFNKAQLKRIYRCFMLQSVADDTNGVIRVATGHTNQRGVQCCYVFDPEELFLYFMSRMKSGHEHTTMCDVFGGSPKRWSYAWRWILKYLDIRYVNIIGHQGLLRYVDQFPDFYTAINEKVQQNRIAEINEHNGTCVYIPGLAFLPVDIFGFIDCSIDAIRRPGSGPNGDYEGAARRPGHDEVQRAFYTGYKKLHGIKVETVLLPNGISTVFGPVSARVDDVNGVLQMSQLNEFLIAIQSNKAHEYQALGDGAYGCNLRCVRSYLKARAGQPPLTAQQQAVDRALRLCRWNIEWGYGRQSKEFGICAHPKHNMIAQEHPYAIEQLRVAHLLTNIATCLKGDCTSGSSMFDCPAPSLEDYLRL
jgi:hypothetical protein